MTHQWQAGGTLVEQRESELHIPSPPLVWVARVEEGVGAALCAQRPQVHQGFQLLYHAVRDRAVELKQDGWRADQVLMAVKRDVAGCAATVTTLECGADVSRLPALLDAVVRWCVEAYYISD
jgi:hypothetical protein